MNKIDFPADVQLSLRGGGVAVLFEFFEGNWYGRWSQAPGQWILHCWQPDGSYYGNQGLPCRIDIVWTPPTEIEDSCSAKLRSSLNGRRWAAAELRIVELEAERDALVSGIEDALICIPDTDTCQDILQRLLDVQASQGDW